MFQRSEMRSGARESNARRTGNCTTKNTSNSTPADCRQPQGLYDPANEHDACGLGFVASIRGEKSHSIVEKGIEVLTHLEHRGACGCDPETGDGAGVLIQIPHEFFARECANAGHGIARARRLRGGHGLSAGRQAGAAAVRRRGRKDHRRRGLRGDGLARYAGGRHARSAAWRAARSPTSSRSS